MEEDTKEKKVQSGGGLHVFQALQYLRKLCNHPLLVLNENDPSHRKIMEKHKSGPPLHALSQAPKLYALK